MFKIVLLCHLIAIVVTETNNRPPRLAGGITAKLGDFPYLVASLHREVRCTASIITPCWVLGAAHCYIVEGIHVDPQEVLLIAGVVDFTDEDCPSRQEREAEFIIIHPRFEEKTISSSDIALVRTEPFLFTPFVSPIRISGDPFFINHEVKCTASGWGDTTSCTTNSILRRLSVTAVQSQKVCHGLVPYQRKNMLCLKHNGGKGLCDGDSGGPLVCHGEVVGVAHQVYTERFLHQGPPNMDCGSPSIVHTYMFLCPYLNWLRKFIPSIPPKPPKCFLKLPKFKKKKNYFLGKAFLPHL